ncbi:MAG: hypothetical protein V3T33_03855 [Myxococcota bacterium]
MFLFTFGCAGSARIYAKHDRRVEAGHFTDAAALLERHEGRLFGKRNALLYHLEMGMLAHLAGDYAESNTLFERAKRIAELLFTESASAQVVSFLSNDRVRAYQGEHFERALIHVFSALNYELLGDHEGALVEARQVDLLLTKIETDLGQKNVYKEDAFARYLSAMLFDSGGNWNDANVAYWKALEAYEKYERDYGVGAPASLLPAALAVAERRGSRALRRMEKRWGAAQPRRPSPEHGEVIVLHYNGWVPHKVESFFELSFGQGWAYVGAMHPTEEEEAEIDTALAVVRSLAADEILRVALPTYVPTPYSIAHVELSAPDATNITPAQLVEDIGAIAAKDLEDRIGRVRAKAIARAAVKYGISKGACEVSDDLDQLLSLLVCGAAKVALIATERADTRFWRNVPDQIWMISAFLPAGEHALSLAFRDAAGQVVAQQTLEGVRIEPGQRTFVVIRTTQ